MGIEMWKCQHCKSELVLNRNGEWVCPKCGTVHFPSFDIEYHEHPVEEIYQRKSIYTDHVITKIPDFLLVIDVAPNEAYFRKCFETWRDHRRGVSFCAYGTQVLTLVDNGWKYKDAVDYVSKRSNWSQGLIVQAVRMVLTSVWHKPAEI